MIIGLEVLREAARALFTDRVDNAVADVPGRRAVRRRLPLDHVVEHLGALVRRACG